MERFLPHRSMFGQMTALTMLLLVVGSYFFAVRPILDMLPPPALDPLDVTAQKVRDTINDETFALSKHPDRAISREFLSVINTTIQHNPNFRYYLKIGDRTVGNMKRPPVYQQLGLDRFEAVRRSMQAPELCAQMHRDFSTPRSKGSMEYVYCDQPRYYEFHGLEHAIPTDVDRREVAVRKVFWSYGSTFFYTVAAILVLVFGVILYNMRTIRRVARLAQSVDAARLDLELPERGIPQEVLPLVRAINQLIARLANAQTRQKFFLSAAAHELRTPLTVLRTRLELLEDAPIKDKLIGDVRRVTNLVNQLLTLMKIDTLDAVSGSLDLVASTRKVIVDLAPLATGRGIAISFAPDAQSHWIRGSSDLIEVAVANLVDNAISFTPDGGEVFIALDEGGMLSVRDFGPGIDPAKASTLFEPFVRYPANRRGYGLGLAIVRAIITLHGGTVTARNADGKGAVFELLFPPENRTSQDNPDDAVPVRIPPFRTAS
jgi:signal transduction histidine kinase